MDPFDRRVSLPGGTFRVLEWPGQEPPAVLLHGLTGTADVWSATVDALGPDGPRCLAIDQRGHGRTAAAAGPLTARRMAADVAALTRALDLDRPHLVGHSMGGRVAMVAAKRYPSLFRSVAIVDIGPEAWRQNWVDTQAGLARMRPSMTAAELEGAIARRQLDTVNAAAFRARFERQADGSFRPLGSVEAMSRMVQVQRSASYWADWEAVRAPALLVRGGESDELRPRVFAEMRRRNPAVSVLEFEGVGHNIPLLAPQRLATALRTFWKESR